MKKRTKQVIERGERENVVSKMALADATARAHVVKPLMTLRFMEDVAAAMSASYGDTAKANLASLVYLGSVDAVLHAKSLRRATGKRLAECIAIVATALPDPGVVIMNECFVTTIATIAHTVQSGKAREIVGDARAWRREYYKQRYGWWRWILPVWWRVML
jgi:hypothetical protein